MVPIDFYYQQVQRPYVDHEGKLNVPAHANEILDYEFIGNLTLNGINIPSNVQKIGSGTFSHCYNATSITLSNGLREISSYAFTGLFKVKNLIIPKSVTKIGRNALHMLNLDYFYVLNPNCIIEQQDCLTIRNTNVKRVYNAYNNTAAEESLNTQVEQFIIQPLYNTN